MMDISDTEFALLSDHLERLCGIAVPPEKSYLFRLRLADFMEQVGCNSFASLHAHLTLRSDPLLQRRLIQAMTNHESCFFRDRHPYQTFREDLLPMLARELVARSRMQQHRLRFLSCGCSAGQEPYSIAMCVHDWLGTQQTFTAADVTILGLDVSSTILARAREAVYLASEVGDHLPNRYLTRYFRRVEDRWQVVPEIRSMVQFIELNLIDELSHAGKFDAVFCRNVIIYFSQEMKKQILERLAALLQPGGVLFLGASESVYKLTDRLHPVHRGQTTYYTAPPAPPTPPAAPTRGGLP